MQSGNTAANVPDSHRLFCVRYTESDLQFYSGRKKSRKIYVPIIRICWNRINLSFSQHGYSKSE